MERIESTISWSAFGLLSTVVLLAPWFFGAWEVWWFWPFVAVLSVSSALFGVQLLLDATYREKHTVSGVRSGSARRRRRARETDSHRPWHVATLVTSLVFLAYAAIRLVQAPVFTDAQRSFLLFMTPFLVGLQVVYGLDGGQRRLLFRMILLNLLLLGLYGILNHAACGSRFVLGRPAFPQYAGRASGSYFCPDHYSGIMEIAFCLALGVLCSRGALRSTRVATVLLMVVALVGILLSKSRGGGLSVLVVLGGVWVWGLRSYSARLRWALRAALPLAGIILVVVATVVGGGYFQRFGAWFGWERAKTEAFPEAINTISRSVQGSSRWIMLSGAMRAWTEAPVFGIGPGMHQNVWPRVAASGDGDIEQRLWPSRLNNTHFSYEVHNDWAQLLEEYGLVGFGLFLVAVVALSGALLRGIQRAIDATTNGNAPITSGSQASAMVLGAWLAVIAMSFHSLGDFNLQMPATTWLFSAVLALGLKGGISRALASSARRTARSESA